MGENKRIVICRRCKKPEYWGEMRWLSGFCVCRDCYKAQYGGISPSYALKRLEVHEKDRGKLIQLLEEFEKENE